jgi:hypothetical protein
VGTLGIITGTKVTRRIDLGDYEESWRGAVFDVWVAPTRAHLQAYGEYNDWLQEHADAEGSVDPDAIPEMYERLDAWLAVTWTNFPTTEGHTALEEVTLIREHLQEVSGAVWEWLYTTTLDAILEYRRGRVKNSPAPSTDT